MAAKPGTKAFFQRQVKIVHEALAYARVTETNLRATINRQNDTINALTTKVTGLREKYARLLSQPNYKEHACPESTVWGYWLVDAKRLASAVLLCFENGSRQAYHAHAFDAVSWLLWGQLTETMLDGTETVYTPSLWPIVTRRETFHRVVSHGRSWVLSFRGAHWMEGGRSDDPR